MKREQTLLIVGGGTGGHAAVAVAVADEACARGHRAIVISDHVGVLRRMAAQHETAVIEDAGIARPRTARARLSRLRVPGRVLGACQDAHRLVDELRPDGVIALGGAAAGVVAVAAARRGVPVIVHEQNAAIGVGNAIAAGVATHITAAFAEASRSSLVVPVPLRRAFLPSAPPRARRVIVIGGSGGSASLNDAVERALPRLVRAGVGGVWLGVSARDGDGDAEGLKRFGWRSDLARDLTEVDVVVTVGGAVTIAEAGAVGRPCVVLPRRDVAGDHQQANAEALAARGAVALTTAATLADDVLAVLGDPDRAAGLTRALRRWVGTDGDAARVLVDLATGVADARHAPARAAE